ncbi:hypothetical protein ABTN50_19200, partial [Acinetobacter baumannii]
HDVFLGPKGGVKFPVPWASDASISHLVTPSGVRDILRAVGFRVESWEDRTPDAIAWFDRMADRIMTRGLPAVSLGVVIGRGAADKLMNVAT